MPIRVRDVSATLKLNAERMGPTNLGCTGSLGRIAVTIWDGLTAWLDGLRESAVLPFRACFSTKDATTAVRATTCSRRQLMS